MKRFVVLALAVLFTLGLQAQASSYPSFRHTASNPTGTVTNNGADTMTLSFGTAAFYNVFSVQPVIAKTSGTVAGKAVLYKSLDGTNYISTGDTLTLANQATNTTIWEKVANGCTYWRIITNGGTTMVVTTSAKYSLKRF